ncbi:UDP-glycosyltransferase 85A2-like [Hibiscus syriacus]|uniref:UDP-glycosyltransferase 85A2-like n=1 Tax=Hibiscus syriacus TaxID=106335 RepID=A0A6A2Y7X8_HIBSY|nr:metacaspase-1-like isoform X2 [Hibiscus syriacus]KAE8677845.1 UDP-glycosyltransferase 85A2-like [Hibiscus syriacus]
MENRLVCENCRQKFSASTTAETVICPHCREVNPNRPLRKQSPTPAGGDQDSLVLSLIRNLLCRILLYCPLRPQLASGQSSDRYPKTCGLDKVGELGDKRAVLCGVSYKKWKYKLKGTINDVFNMKNLLIEQYKYEEENMLLLTEEQPDARLIPTKANIENCLKWLVKDCKSGDSLVFYYSGHGLRQPDFENDELDGFDETICPVDFLKEGMILDNDIYDTIVKPLIHGVKLHAIVDACHSGTILDLEHVYDREKKEWTDNKPPSGKRKQTRGGKAYCISACEDDQVAADTTAFSSKQMSGALTYILIEVVRGNPGISYGKLLDKMQDKIDQANQQGCAGGSGFLSTICGPNLTQRPLLSASEEFDIYQTKFQL